MSEDLNETTVSDSAAVPARELARQIGADLNETNLPLIQQIITVIGPERTQDFLRESLDVEAKGGLLTRKGDRRRTPGGVFFYLVRYTIAGREKRQIWPIVRKKAAAANAKSRPHAPAPVLISWEQALELAKQAKAQPGEAKTVKITLIGRPLKIIQQAECVILSMKGKEPGSFPKGLPAPPAASAITWAVFIANKQWTKVAASLAEQPEDNLIVEGYPLLKDGVAVVLAQSCKSVFLEKAAKAQKASQ